ncbi:branched-chain-amino-acid transaminase [Desulfotomaculum copahuensis]|uniref:Branched-chain-amino-acid aminotransferase n=1 Tax=Desulfotomaculum copahuensis TaxID=1838280 RepID=A0A1B7LFI3_9FIRM|nr:branched-chain-amino-acid transaminase [Desulfotomaculum copahuensis]OAT82374.1 branched-chain amino acid aminotransferase [Desulfotomaculum copahuensis]
MGLIIYLNGQYVPEEQAVVSVFDHGLLYGDGIFEGIRAYYNHVFKLEEHLVRLYESARSLGLNIPISKAEMEEVVLETCRRNNLKDAYIRLVVTRGRGDLGLDPRNCPTPTIFCIAASIQLYPDELYERGMELVTVPTRRNLTEASNPQIKSLNYLNNIFAKMEASLMGAPEGLLLNQEGYVAEATGDNIFIIKNGVLITPPPFAGILVGVTRNTIMQIAREKGMPVEEKLFTRHAIYTADECFLTGTAAEAIPVVKLDGREIGSGRPGEMTWELIRAFRELTKVDGPLIFKD